MDKEIRIAKTKGVWTAELWSEHEEPFIPGMYFEDNVSATDYLQLQVEIGNKNWVDILNK